MSVYFIREGDLIKIGFSTNVRSRAAAIINGLIGKGELLGSMPGGRDLEKHLHRKFEKDHEYGEWFHATPELLALIQAMASVDPVKDETKPSDRLQTQEERYAEEAAYFIRNGLKGVAIEGATFTALERATSITAERLRAIYDGTVCPITAGEYVVLRTIYDAALGISPEDVLAAQTASREWAEQYGAGRAKGHAAMQAAGALSQTTDRGEGVE